MSSPVERLRRGEAVDDDAFDALFPERIAALSRQHWTTVEVARRAAALLTDGLDGARVVDVGSGVGKFVLVAALVTRGHVFTGVERRRELHDVAQSLQDAHAIEGVELVHGEAADVDFGAFDGFYFHNPFYENIDPSVRIDDDASLSRTRHTQEVLRMLGKIRAVRDGVRAVTHHGMGAAMPSSFRRVLVEPSRRLEMWVKGASPP